MPLSYADIIVPNGAEMDSDFFNRRYQLIVNAIAEALAAANLYGTTSKQLLDLGLSQVNGVLGPLLTKISSASTLGFLIGKSGSSVILIAGDSAVFTINEATRGLFTPTPFLTVLDNGDATKFASLELVSYNAITGVLQVNVTLVAGGSSINAADWTIAASGGLPTLLFDLSDDAGTARDEAVSANTDAQAAAATCTALASAFSAGGVASVAGKTGIVTLGISDIIGLVTALAGKLSASSNLGDLANPSTARSNLALGSAATHLDTDFLKTANNLSDVASPVTARANLSLGTSATLNAGLLPNNLVQLDGSAKLPAVDGSSLTNLPNGFSLCAAILL